MNNRTLTIIFLALLGLYLLTRLFSGGQEKSFRSELVQVDTSLVDKIELYAKAAREQVVTLTRTNGQWTVSNGALTAPATNSAVNSLLGQLSLLRAKRVVAREEEKWKDYEVEESTGSQVKAYQNGNVVANFIVGRLNFNQQTRQAISYVRLADEPEVYAVDGFLSMTFGQEMNAFRNKQLLKLEAGQEINSLQLTAGGATAGLQKVNGQWMLNGAQALDSTQMTAYLNGLRYVAGNTFADGFTPTGGPEQTLRIEAGGTAVTVDAFRHTEGETDFVIRSSQFPQGQFASDSLGIYDRLFGKLSAIVN